MAANDTAIKTMKDDSPERAPNVPMGCPVCLP